MLSLALLLLASPAVGQTVPYRSFSEAGTGFYGHGRELQVPAGLRSVRIGLTGPEKSREGMHLKNGTALAVQEANAQGGCSGLPFEVVFRPDDGPWGMGAKQIVKLAYEDEVWAILGGLNGGQAHLAELVSAKAWVPIVVPVASDVTIDYANVPWVFRCMPDDSAQAKALLWFAKKKGYRRVCVISEANRESYLGWKRLSDAARHKRYPFALHLEYDPLQPESVLSRFQNAGVDAVIVWGSPESVVILLSALRKAGIGVPVLGPSYLATPFFAEQASSLGEIIVAAPFELTKEDSRTSSFRDRYLDFAGFPPTPAAFYAYDAAMMVIEAIQRVGLNRCRLRDALADASYEGLTGKVAFNSLGGNLAEPVLVSLQAGKWHRLDQ